MCPEAMADLAERLRGVYWLGGGSGAGKSTVALALARHYGLKYYSTDAAMGDHLERMSPESAPYMHAFRGMNMDERWLHRSPTTMLETFGWFRGEGFDEIVDDLLAMPRNVRVIVEGFRVLPDRVFPLLYDKRHAMWLLPSPQFRRVAFARRGDLWRIAGHTSNPQAALGQLLQRDAMFTARVGRAVAAKGLNSVAVDDATELDELVGTVARYFGMSTSD